MSQIGYVKLADLHLWTDNPRLGNVEGEISEIIGLIKKQQTKSGNKLTTLAESLIKEGILEPIGVLKDNDGFMIVKEGNRRVTCLKLLKDPNIIPLEYSQVKKTFIKLKNKLKPEICNSIPARIFNESENEELERWIELRHNGVQDGKGLDGWGSREKENWSKYMGKNTPVLDFHNFLISIHILNPTQINSVSKTNWERILGSVGRSYLGLDLKNGKYIITIEENDFKRRILRTIEHLKGRSVAIVYDNETIKAFFESLNFNNEELVNDIESNVISKENGIGNNYIINNTTLPKDKVSNNFELDTPKSEPTTKIEDFTPTDDNKKRRYSSKPAPLLSNIICNLKSTNDTDGIIRLTAELKKMSKEKDYVNYPIATAMLMRNLLEQSLIYYLKQRNKWNKFYASKKNEPTLSEILEKYEKDTDILAQDKTLERYFNLIFETPGLKEYFNMIVHHPHKFGATPEALDAIIAKSGYAALIQYIIDYTVMN